MRSLGAIVIVTLCMAIRLHGAPNQTDILSLVTDLSNNFWAKHSAAFAGNVTKSHVRSPLLDFLSLSMMSYGARGSTKSKLMKALGLTNHNPVIVLQSFQKLIHNLNNYTEFNFCLRNKIFISSGCSPEPEFVNLTESFFDSLIESIDLDNENLTTQEIDNWYMKKSNQQSTKLFTPQQKGLNRSIIFASAMSFEGRWAKNFDSSHHMYHYFEAYGGGSTPIRTMYKFGWFRYGELPDLDSKFVQIPFKENGQNHDIHMFIFRSNSHNAYWVLAHQLATINITQLILGYSLKRVHVFLPKLKITTDVSSNFWFDGFFESDNPFEPNANMSGILSSPEVSFTESVNKVTFSVDQCGSKMSQMAGSVFKTRKTRSPTREGDMEFVVNRPFAIIIATITPKIMKLLTVSISGREFIKS